MRGNSPPKDRSAQKADQGGKGWLDIVTVVPSVSDQVSLVFRVTLEMKPPRFHGWDDALAKA